MPDIVVVGGGIIGTACAFELTRSGAVVTLLERDELAAGASGRNLGYLDTSKDPILAPLKSRLIDLAEELMRTQEMLAAYDLHDAMARSAAERLTAKTTDILAAIESGTAKAAEVRAAATYRARNEIAAAHLDARSIVATALSALGREKEALAAGESA